MAEFQPLGQRSLMKMSHDQAVTHVNQTVHERRTQAASSGSLEQFYSQQEGILLDGLSHLRNSLTDARTKRTLYDIAQRYTQADQHLSPDTSLEERVTARISRMYFPDGLHVVSDLDNTITEGSHYLLAAIPASAIAEPLLQERGREHFPRVFVETWQHALTQYPKLYERGGKQEYAPLRPGVHECFSYLKAIGAKRTILSANFEPFVRGVLKRIPSVDRNVEVHAVRKNDIRATDKGTYLQLLAKQNPTRALMYFGDGASDLPALDAKDVVACYFALEGSVFAQELAKADIPHFTYRNFHDITLQLQRLQETTVHTQAA